MSDIFISYAREDQRVAQKLASVLEAYGWSVWWDKDLVPGEQFQEVIEHELEQARAVIVLWSRVSVGSQWVRSEASYAADRGVLVPVLTEATAVPLRFRILQAVDLSSWHGSTDEPRLQQLLAGVRSVAAASAGAAVPAPPRARRQRDDVGAYTWPSRIGVGLAAFAVVALGVAGGATWAARSSRAGSERMSTGSGPGSSDGGGPVSSGPISTGGHGGPAVQPGHELALAPPAISPYCVARDSQDAHGHPVSFAPANLVDGDPTTAWRCGGDATRTALVFSLDPSTTVTRLGLVAGYAKVDPYDARYDRFFENRRITAVTWVCRRAGAEIGRVPQVLDPDVRALQAVEPVGFGPCDAVWLQLDGVTEPGAYGAVARDFTAISDVSISGAAA